MCNKKLEMLNVNKLKCVSEMATQSPNIMFDYLKQKNIKNHVSTKIII